MLQVINQVLLEVLCMLQGHTYNNGIEHCIFHAVNVLLATRTPTVTLC